MSLSLPRAIAAGSPVPIGRIARSRPVRTWLAVLFTVAIYAWRSGDGVTAPQLWAEDGVVFFTQAQTLGVSSLVTPSAGYLQVGHRLVALFASLFSATLAPHLYIAFTIAIVAWTAAVVATAEDRHSRLLAASMMLVPVGDEVLGVITNVQWFAQVGLLVIAITPSPRSRAVRLNQIAFASFCALDGPFAIFAAPLMAWRLWTCGRDIHAWAIGLIVAVGAAVQFAFAVRAGSPYDGLGLHEPSRLASTMLDRWIGQSAHRGLTLRPQLVRADAVFGACLLAAALTSGPIARKALLYAGFLLAATYSRFLTYSDYLADVDSGERYFYQPRLALVWCLLLCAIRLRPSSVFGLVGLVMMGLSIEHWVRTPFGFAPWRDGALEIDQGRAVEIVINPSDPADPGPTPWMVRVPGRR